MGNSALAFNSVGGSNTAVGDFALLFNMGGNRNTAVGAQALYSNQNAVENTAIGTQALHENVAGQHNTATGYQALYNCTGDTNIAVGNGAGFNLTGGNSDIDIGNAGFAGESNTIRVGTVGTQTATFIAGISVAMVTGTPVVVNASGQLGVAPSSRRFKDQIKSMDNTSEAILALRPVTFRYKQEIDSGRAPQFGLLAEDVEKVNRDLVVRDKEGKPYSVRYEQVNAMLLNEFLKEHKKVEDLTKDFQTTVAQQQKQIEALTAGLQKVSAQLAAASPSRGGLEASKPSPQVVNNP
jgi:hypothetical protein